jgi:hypothetical protein
VVKKKQIKIIYIAHDKNSVDECLKSEPSATIILVGPQDIGEDIKYVEVIIARDLPNNIEDKKKLLTFTAWYAIIKNDLFINNEHLCLLEWDCKLPKEKLEFNKDNDVGAFFQVNHSFMPKNINKSIFQNYLKNKKLQYENFQTWYATTNCIVRRSILSEFVDFYFPSCVDDIEAYKEEAISWYHERIFFIYILHKKLKIQFISGSKHYGLTSHKINKIN